MIYYRNDNPSNRTVSLNTCFFMENLVALYVGYATVFLSDSQIYRTLWYVVDQEGGQVHAYNTKFWFNWGAAGSPWAALHDGELSLHSCSALFNTGRRNGFLSVESTKVAIENSTFSKNFCHPWLSGSGLITADKSAVLIRGSVFQDNAFLAVSKAEYGAGVIVASNSTLLVEDSVVERCSCVSPLSTTIPYSAGGIYAVGVSILRPRQEIRNRREESSM